MSTSNKKKSKSLKLILLKFFLKWGFIFSIWIMIAIIIIFAYYSKDLPNITPKINPYQVNYQLLYSNNEELYKYGNLNSDIENYAEFPPYLINALIATEDRKFFKHHGFDYLGIIRAMLINIKSGYIKQGGSTITQQLAKMLLKNSKRTLKRKIQELLLSIQLEKVLSKEKILTMYLNNAYFGAGKYGIKSASKFYFDKKVSSLELEECALLIGLLKAPTKYSPQNDIMLSQERTKQVITNMYNAHLLSKEDFEEYLDKYFTTILEASYNSNKRLNEKMYFADYVKNQIPDWTNEKNIEIKTTLVKEIQDIIENNIIRFTETYSEKLKKAQIAVIILNKKGEIIGMTGGINYDKTEFNRAIYAQRQPGSAFKLFVFLTGLKEKQWKPDRKFIDEPVFIGNWYPENYNEKYYGNIDMKTAFAKSSNSVSIQIAEWAGLNNVAKLARKMGIRSKIDKDDPTMALGTPLVNLLELTSAYSVITNNGYAIIPYSILEIKNKDNNNIIYKRKDNNQIKILEETETKYIKEMLYEVINSGTGQNAKINSLIDKGFEYTGGKTGTSQNYSDAWFIGYANDITIGIWIGNDDNKPMKKTTGGSLPAILWRNIVTDIITKNDL